MTKGEANKYALGYQAGLRRKWPTYYPPHPPEPQVRALFQAAQELQDAAVGLLQVIIPDEEIFMELKRKADAMDVAFAQITAWLKKQQPSPAGEPRWGTGETGTGGIR